MKRFEYKRHGEQFNPMKSEDDYINELNEFGSEGWEIIDVRHFESGYVMYLMKREIPEPCVNLGPR